MSKFFKRKEKQTDTGPKTNIEQPTIQVNEERLEHGEASGRKEKSKGNFFFSVQAGITQEVILKVDIVRDLGGIAKPDDQTEELPVQESIAVQDAIDRAEQRVQTMHMIGSAAQKVAEIGAQGDAGLAKVDTVSDLLQPLKIFDSVVKALGDVIITQANKDSSIKDLLSRIADVYKFLVKDGQLKEVVSMKDILAQTSEVILECAKFIQSYSQPNFCELGM
ncbi:hypothetical protein JOM56_001028 [Amanita muscaria]